MNDNQGLELRPCKDRVLTVASFDLDSATLLSRIIFVKTQTMIVVVEENGETFIESAYFQGQTPEDFIKEVKNILEG